MPAYPEFQGQTILITGGANGIGAAMVRAFHSHGARVCFCDLDATAGRALSRELGPNTSFARVDLTSETGIQKWIRAIGKSHLAIHALINNAAVDPRISLEELTSRSWDHLFAANLRAFFLTCQEATRFMKAGSAIVNFSSITVHTAPANMSAYVATKAGIQGFTRSLARELGPRRIRVNTLSPGWIMTERQLAQYVDRSVKKLIRSSQCVPDLIQPEEIAEVALFLASQGSRAVTGQEILADRGWAHS